MLNRMNRRDGPRIALIADAEILDEWSANKKLRIWPVISGSPVIYPVALGIYRDFKNSMMSSWSARFNFSKC